MCVRGHGAGARADRQRLSGPPGRRPGWSPVYALLGLSRSAGSTETSTPGGTPRGLRGRRHATSRSPRPASIYLRDQLVTDVERPGAAPTLATAIVDEADSILIDEARVPLVLAGSVATESDPAARGRRAGGASCSPSEDYEAGRGRPYASAFTDAGHQEGRANSSGVSDLYADDQVEQLSSGQRGAATPVPCCAATSTIIVRRRHRRS